ncbi:hypothetical protein Emag_003474 [Eimeria magna]
MGQGSGMIGVEIWRIGPGSAAASEAGIAGYGNLRKLIISSTVGQRARSYATSAPASSTVGFGADAAKPIVRLTAVLKTLQPLLNLARTPSTARTTSARQAGDAGSPTAEGNHISAQALEGVQGLEEGGMESREEASQALGGKGWTQPPESLVAKMKGQVEDSPAVEEISDQWSSPFAKLERQWDDIYLAEFPEVTAAPRGGTPSWTSFLSAFSRQFIARPSARVREVRGWKEIPEYEPEIQPDPNPVRFIFSALQALGGLLAPRARHDEEDSNEVVEARPALPTPASSGVSAELEGSAELSPLPAARAPGSARAAPQPAPTSPAAPLPKGSIGQGPLPPLSPTTTAATNALGNLASQGWDFMATAVCGGL